MRKTLVRLAMLVGIAGLLTMMGGCTKKEKATAVGTVIGAAAGAGIGAAVGNGAGAAIGGVSGGLLGGLIGNNSTD